MLTAAVGIPNASLKPEPLRVKTPAKFEIQDRRSILQRANMLQKQIPVSKMADGAGSGTVVIPAAEKLPEYDVVVGVSANSLKSIEESN